MSRSIRDTRLTLVNVHLILRHGGNYEGVCAGEVQRRTRTLPVVIDALRALPINDQAPETCLFGGKCVLALATSDADGQDFTLPAADVRTPTRSGGDVSAYVV